MRHISAYCSYWSLKPTDFNGGCDLTVRYARLFTIAQAEPDQNKCPLYGIVGCPQLRGFECIEVYGNTIRTFRIVRYIAGVRR